MEFCRDVDMVPGRGEPGLIVLDEQGCLQHITPQARRLLFLATHVEVKEGIRSLPENQSRLPDKLISLAQRSIIESDDQIPQWITSNPWGKFLFQANWFQTPTEGNKALIAVTVQHLEPILYRCLAKCDELGFTGRQTEIVTGLLKGGSHNSIAKQLHISGHTVTDHVKKIYKKLGICNRNQLLMSLLSVQATDR